MPLSFAIFFANGEANILPSFTTAVGALATGAAITGVDETGADATGVAIGSALASSLGALLALTDFTILSMSKPGCPMIHNN